MIIAADVDRQNKNNCCIDVLNAVKCIFGMFVVHFKYYFCYKLEVCKICFFGLHPLEFPRQLLATQD